MIGRNRFEFLSTNSYDHCMNVDFGKIILHRIDKRKVSIELQNLRAIESICQIMI